MRSIHLSPIAAPAILAFSTATFAASPSALFETVGPSSLHSSIAVDRNHVPHIASLNSITYNVRYSSRSGGVWTSEEIAYGAISSNRALRFDAAGWARIVAEQKLMIRTSTGWTIADAPGGYNWWEASAIDNQGVSRVIYLWSWGSGSYNGGFRFEWEDIAPNIFWPTNPSCEIEYDASGAPHLVATLNQGQPVQYWRKVDASWVSENLPAGVWPSLAIDAGNTVHVCYQAYPSLDLVHAIRTGPDQWLTEPVDTDGDVGKSPSLAIDAEGGVHVTYYDATHGDLKYAISNGFGSPWNVVTLDAAGDVGQWSSLALDGTVSHVSYYDVGNESLRYAQVVGSITAVGDSPALPSLTVRAVPNPFNPSTTLVYTVPARGRVRVTVLDVSGRVVERLVDSDRDPGEYRVQYRARTASGVYFARVEAGGRVASTKVVVLK